MPPKRTISNVSNIDIFIKDGFWNILFFSCGSYPQPYVCQDQKHYMKVNELAISGFSCFQSGDVGIACWSTDGLRHPFSTCQKFYGVDCKAVGTPPRHMSSAVCFNIQINQINWLNDYRFKGFFGSQLLKGRYKRRDFEFINGRWRHIKNKTLDDPEQNPAAKFKGKINLLAMFMVDSNIFLWLGPPMDCFTTRSSPQPNARCRFPFKYKGITRYGCIDEQDPDGRFWCSTQVDSNGNHVTGKGFWGYCRTECLVSDPFQSESIILMLTFFFVLIMSFIFQITPKP